MEEQALKWWHVRWRPVAIFIGKVYLMLCLVAAIGYGVLYLTEPWREAKLLSKFEPGMNAVPATLPTQAQAPLSDVSIDDFGFKFQLPRKEIDKTRETQRSIIVSFRNGGTLLIFDNSPYPGIESIPSVAKWMKLGEKLLGREVAHSESKLMQAAMLTTPDQVKWWRFRSSENMKAEFLLSEKLSAVMGCTISHDPSGRIFAISFGQFHGFQCGNLNAAPYEARIDVFNEVDRHFRFQIMAPQGHGQVLTQEELNAIVASVRPTQEH